MGVSSGSGVCDVLSPMACACVQLKRDSIRKEKVRLRSRIRSPSLGSNPFYLSFLCPDTYFSHMSTRCPYALTPPLSRISPSAAKTPVWKAVPVSLGSSPNILVPVYNARPGHLVAVLLCIYTTVAAVLQG